MSQIADNSPEFKKGDGILSDIKSRRNFLKFIGTSMALGGLSSCTIRKPKMYVTPYVFEEEGHISGEANFYASAFCENEFSHGILVKTFENRPTKIESNAKIPNCKGTSLKSQASLLNLYDPDRVKTAKIKELEISKKNIEEYLYNDLRSKIKTEETVIFYDNITSVSEQNLLRKLKNENNVSLIRCDCLRWENERKAIKKVYGKAYYSFPDFTKTDLIISFDQDFLGLDKKSIDQDTAYAEKKDIEYCKSLIRHYQFETVLSITGSKADERFAVSRTKMEASLALLGLLILKGNTLNTTIQNKLDQISLNLDEKETKIIKIVAKDLLKNKRKSVILCGRYLPNWCHDIVLQLNIYLGNINSSLKIYKPSWIKNNIEVSTNEQLKILEKKNATFKNVITLGTNPRYLLSNNEYLKRIYSNASVKVHLTETFDETSKESTVIIPKSHFLESWGDTLSFNGNYSIVQPVIEPLYESFGTLRILGLLCGLNKDSYTIIKEQYSGLATKDNIKQTLKTGYTKINTGITLSKGKKLKDIETDNIDPGNYLHIRESLVFGSGKNINNAWLQEVPDPLTKLTWDNCLEMNEREAQAKGLKLGDIVQLQLENNKSIELPVLPLPGIKKENYKTTLGYGQKIKGKIGNSVGFNCFDLLTDDEYTQKIKKIVITGKNYPLAKTQEGYSQHGRDLLKERDLADYKKDKKLLHHGEHPPLKSLWEEKKYDNGPQWGMVIDLNKCTGCNACVIACQAENNIPTVGKSQVIAGREMHWIRIDRYIEEDEHENIKSGSQPIGCMNCELAPCEQVCPVNATVHDEEGLNVMVYNRCIGTRYCANNCPYKVRRFNYFDWHQTNPHAEKNTEKQHLFDHPKRPPKAYRMQFNPDVTVRMRGVMEKCTFCIHKIQEEKIKAKNKGDVDFTVITACQDACSSEAIVFGNINNSNNEVSKKRKSYRGYDLLEALNIKPRTKFLASLKNLNPELHKEKEISHANTHH